MGALRRLAGSTLALPLAAPLSQQNQNNVPALNLTQFHNNNFQKLELYELYQNGRTKTRHCQ